MEEVKCKVCNQMFPLTETFCPECGFERHIYPEPLSPDLKSYEEERIKKYKEQRKKQEEKLKDKEEAYNKASSQLSEAHDRLKQKEEELKNAEMDARANKQRIAQLERDLNDAQQKAVIRTFMKPKAYLLFENGGNKIVAAVYEGKNTYGSRSSDIQESTHYKVAILGLRPRQFCIDASDKHFRLFDLIGNMTTSANESINPQNGISLSSVNRTFYVGDDIKITFTLAS